MRSKTILSIAAFIVAFAFSTALASLFIDKSSHQSNSITPAGYNRRATSCFKKRGNYTAGKIETFIRRDISNGDSHIRKLYEITGGYRWSPFASSSFAEYADIVTEYVDKSSSMNTENLPPDLENAWFKHMKAWHDYSKFLEMMKDSPAREKLSVENSDELENRYGSEIRSTWFEILSIGRSYGAEVY